ncbi:hypothetical protein DPEC_G00237630 [Dallia pectoralis]|uniref:Uncharacterized protein n=1 Tax=Dallia pectoralis TaxID=75939 RepID=A0ACC2FYR0_DALPE|nr:hypothetical protein DPEC_G00237630 [Dallia pectoralis]
MTSRDYFNTHRWDVPITTTGQNDQAGPVGFTQSETCLSQKFEASHQILEAHQPGQLTFRPETPRGQGRDEATRQITQMAMY